MSKMDSQPTATIFGPVTPTNRADGQAARVERIRDAPWQSPLGSAALMKIRGRWFPRGPRVANSVSSGVPCAVRHPLRFAAGCRILVHWRRSTGPGPFHATAERRHGQHRDDPVRGLLSVMRSREARFSPTGTLCRSAEAVASVRRPVPGDPGGAIGLSSGERLSGRCKALRRCHPGLDGAWSSPRMGGSAAFTYPRIRDSRHVRKL